MNIALNDRDNLSALIEKVPYCQLGFSTLDAGLKNDNGGGTAMSVRLAQERFVSFYDSLSCDKCKCPIEKSSARLTFISKYIPKMNIRQITNVVPWCSKCLKRQHLFLNAFQSGVRYDQVQQWPELLNELVDNDNYTLEQITGTVDKMWEDFVIAAEAPCIWDLNFLKSRNLVDENFYYFRPSEAKDDASDKKNKKQAPKTKKRGPAGNVAGSKGNQQSKKTNDASHEEQVRDGFTSIANLGAITSEAVREDEHAEYESMTAGEENVQVQYSDMAGDDSAEQ